MFTPENKPKIIYFFNLIILRFQCPGMTHITNFTRMPLKLGAHCVGQTKEWGTFVTNHQNSRFLAKFPTKLPPSCFLEFWENFDICDFCFFAGFPRLRVGIFISTFWSHGPLILRIALGLLLELPLFCLNSKTLLNNHHHHHHHHPNYFWNLLRNTLKAEMLSWRVFSCKLSSKFNLPEPTLISQNAKA